VVNQFWILDARILDLPNSYATGLKIFDARIMQLGFLKMKMGALKEANRPTIGASIIYDLKSSSANGLAGTLQLEPMSGG